ncbi:MAG: DUF86 domain-containing protein [Candidatus Sungbacteria bacterium]|nr:DUF86 domain-containing protein [Candidatus Sungbacteria bacterium]
MPHIAFGDILFVMDNSQNIQALKEYFTRRDDVVMAFLFGSQAKRYARATSDWDIGLYFKPSLPHKLELEEDRDYPAEHEVWGAVEKIVHAEVDLVVLNRAPATIVDTAMRGVPLVMKDQKLWLEFLLRVTSEAIDFRKTAREYADVYWRSSSLSEGDRYTLNRRLVFLDGELNLLREYRTLNWTGYQEDNKTRRVVERAIENIMNAIIDISKTLLASEKREIPQTYRDIVRLAGTIPGAQQEVADRLSLWVDLRNILAHEYLDYRWKEIRGFLQESEPYIEKFIDAVKKFLEEGANQ